MNKNQMLESFKLLDKRLKSKANLLLGGGGAMVLAYQFPLATQDLDAEFYKSSIKTKDIRDEILAVATELSLPGDWLNPHFETFLFTLPADYESRLKTVFEGDYLVVNALGPEDLLILKCFAGRDKDIPHARALIKKGANIDFVEKHINYLIDKSIPGANAARDFLDELLDEMGTE